MTIIWWMISIVLYVEYAFTLNNWPNISDNVLIALRSQRDIMVNISIDQLSMIGVELNSMVSIYNYNHTYALELFNTLLSFGVQALVVDLESNTGYDDLWVLKNTNIGLQDILIKLRAYLDFTNNNIYANLIVLILRFDNNRNSTISLSHTNFTNILESSIGTSYIYSQNDLKLNQKLNKTFSVNEQSDVIWPTLGSFLYSKKRRLVITSLNNDFNTSLNNYIFGPSILDYNDNNLTITCPLRSMNEVVNLSLIAWRFLQSEYQVQTIQEYPICGYSPIISGNYSPQNISEVFQLLNASLSWSWAKNQPASNPRDMLGNGNSTNYTSFRCAVFHYSSSNNSGYWEVANCYEKKQGLCKHKYNEFTFNITYQEADYFSMAMNQHYNCPENYFFSIPRTPLQQKALEIYLNNIESPDVDIWIDINSISVTNCWVTGGPYAICPYKKAISTRNLIKTISPLSILSLLFLGIAVFLNCRRVPIQDNRKRWCKVINDYSKLEIEGVPS